MKPLAVSIYYFYKVKKKISTALNHFPTTGTNMGDCLIQNNVHGNGFRRPGLTSNKIKSKVCSLFLLRKCFHQGLVLASKLSDEKAILRGDWCRDSRSLEFNSGYLSAQRWDFSTVNSCLSLLCSIYKHQNNYIF